MTLPDAWRVRGGQVAPLVLPAPPCRYVVPQGITTPDGVPVELLPGHHHPDYPAVMPMVVDIAVRLTPWATWYLAPAFVARDHPYSGTAWGSCEVAVCRTDLDPVTAVTVALHEAWHLAEVRLRPHLLAELDARLSLGPDWPSSYLADPTERRARAFTAFGLLLVEGLRIPVQGRDVPFELSLFWHLFSGDLGREVLAMDAPPPPPGLLHRTASWLGL